MNDERGWREEVELKVPSLSVVLYCRPSVINLFRIRVYTRPFAVRFSSISNFKSLFFIVITISTSYPPGVLATQQNCSDRVAQLATPLQKFIFVLSLGIALLNASASPSEENVPCDRYAHELSKECIAELGLQGKAAIFETKIAEAQRRYGASYKIRLQVIGDSIWECHDANTG